MEEEFQGSQNQTEDETQFQKFQMMDKPYQSFIDKKAKMGQKEFSFVPPKKHPDENFSRDTSFEEEEKISEAENIQPAEKPLFPQGESLPNPYGEAKWQSFGSDVPDFQIPTVQPPVASQDLTEGTEQNKKSRKNTGLIIFLVTVGVIFCAVAVGFVVLTYSDGNNNYEGNSVETTTTEEQTYEEETTESSTRYINYLRDDVSIELVPQTVDGESSAEKAYEKILPSTVLIVTNKEEWSENVSEVYQGTGVVIHSDGYIVTNSHVVDNSRDSQVMVIDNMGNISQSVVVGCDPETDIAVIKVDGIDLEPAEFAETENLKVGQEVVALGNPEGIYFRNSLTKGIISAINRKLDKEITYIQVDAAINPGNSGGPLCNMDGQIIGINTSKLAKENFEGIGLAIPSDTVREVANDIIKYGEARERLSLGIYGYRITEEDSEESGMPAGVLIAEVIEESPAYNSELQAGDVVVSIDGENVDSVEDIKRILYDRNDGDVMEVGYMRPVQDEENDTVYWEELYCEIELYYY